VEYCDENRIVFVVLWYIPGYTRERDDARTLRPPVVAIIIKLMSPSQSHMNGSSRYLCRKNPTIAGQGSYERRVRLSEEVLGGCF